MSQHPHPPDLHGAQRGQFVVAYDGSAAARIALAHAADLADPGGVVTAVNVIAYQAISARIEQASDARRARQQELLREAERALTRSGITAHIVAAIGDPAFEILRIAEGTNAEASPLGSLRRPRRSRRRPKQCASVTDAGPRGAVASTKPFEAGVSLRG